MSDRNAGGHQDLAALERIAAQVNATLDLERIFHLILETLDDVFGFAHSMILVPDAGCTRLSVVVSRGYPESGVGAHVELGHGVIGVVAKKRRMMRLVGLSVMQRRYIAMSSHASQPVALPGLPDARSQIAIPLVARERLLGVYAVESPEHDAFDAVDERLLSIVGHLVAIAIDNATAYADLQRTAQELQHQVVARSRELGDALAKLGQTTPLALDRVIDGRYRICRKLGMGGMGSVYEVEHDGKRLALKTLRGRGDAQLLARFAREAEIAASLDHPNLVPVLDIGIADGSLFLVMPLLAGGSLEHLRPRFGDVVWARPLLAQIAAGMSALHDRGIVHRDLKPANVLLANGVAQIADFGLASLRPDEGATAASQVDELDETAMATPLTRAGDLFGTPAYMAPELASGALDARPASDIFAFGVLAFELLSGRRPFDEPPIQARARGAATVPPARLELGDLGDLVARCLDLEPMTRPTALDLVTALR